MARRKSAFLSLGGYYRRLVNYHCRLVNCAFVFAVALLVSILSGQYVFADTHNVTTIRILTNPNNQYSSLNALLANPAGATANDAANVPIIFNLNRNIVYNPINPVIVLTTDTQSNFLYIQHDYNYISIDYPDSNNASMTGGGATPAYTLNINKDGIGTWRLYGDNNGTGTNETFNVNAGMLELFDGSITVNPSGQSGTFNVSGGAAFNVHRSDTNGTTVTAKQGFNFAAGSTIGLDLTNSAGISNPVLTLAGGNLNAANGRTINLLGFSGTGGGAIALDLLRYNYTGAAPVAPETFSAPPLRAVNESKAAPQDAAYDPNLDFMVRGETWNAVVAASGGRLGGTLEQTSTVGANNANTSTISIANYFAQVGTVRWNDGGADDNWNATSSNWTGTGSIAGSETFLHGDNVVFGGAGETVTVQAGGVQIGQIGGNVRNGNGMRAESGEYTFVNDAGSIIGIDGPGGVHVTSLLGAVAPTIVTFQSANSYWGDTVIDTNGQIILQDTAGLGTSNVYLNGGVLTFDTTVADDRFYNEIYGTGGGILEKLGPNMVTLFGDNMSNADTHVTEGSLRNNIGTGVLYVSYDAFYNSSENVNDYGTGTGKSRSIAGLNDGLNDTDPPGFGGTVNMGTKPANDDVILTIDVEQFSRYEFHGQITGGTTPDNGVKVNKRGKGTQIFSSNTVDEGRNNNYTGGTVVYDGYLIAKENLQYDPSDLDTEYRYRTTPFGTGTVTINKPFQNPENSALIFDINHDVTFPDPIPYPPVAVARVGNVFRGDGKVIKRGDAVLSLYGDSRGGTNRIDNYIGRVDVQKGYLRIEHNYALGKAEDITLYGDNPNTAENEKTVLQFLAADSTGGPLGAPTLLPGNTRDNPFDRVITGAGDVEVLENTILYLKGTNDADSVLGPGTVIGDSDYTGKTIVKGGAELIIRNAAGTGNTSAVVMEKGDSAPLPSPSTFTLDFDSADDGAGGQRYDRYITGAGNLQKMGAGAAYLVRENSVSPDNDYTGRTLIKEGVLKIAYAGATGAKDIPPDQNVEISAGAKLELAFDIDETYEKGITGAGSLAKSGSTTATLGGISSYTGGTYIYEGTLSFYNADPLTVGNLGTGGIYFQRGGGILQNRNDVNDLNQDVYIDSDSTATFETLANLTNSQGIYNNNVPGGTRSELVKIGSANLYLNGDAEWTGSTIIKEGWLHNNVPETTDLYVYTGAGYNTGTGTSVGGGRNERTVASIHGENDFSGGTITVVSGTDLVVKYRDKSKKDIFAGTIEGEGGLVFDAEGTTLHLTGGNTYLGSTTIRGVNGTLIGNISTNTSLDIGLSNTYKSDGRDRQIRQLTGFGDVDMQGKSLTIAQNDPSKNPVFSGRILNGYNLNKIGIGSQHLAGNINISSNVEVRNGELILGGLNLNGVDFPATVNIGKDLIVHPKSLSDIPTLTVKKNAAINVGNNFNVQGQLNFDADNSLVEAGSSVTLGKDSILNVTGIGNNDLELIIRSKGAPINDDFGTVTVAGSAPTQDFLVLGVQKSEDKKEIWVGQTLSWYAGNDAHGTFTLQGGSSYYRVGRELHDVSGTFDPAVWDGKTLTKKGEGTLELSRQNTYTGRTVVDDGTLKLTHEKATGGSSGIILSGGTLEIDFDSRDRNGVWSNGLETLISGAGGVR
ncbi:MAG: autotransporter-associated beta strand repeat-containing protein, partial [Planctomycetaceae bacterium]|nr:autotransporter-associated beta strand repeat-containing protein [Planctomycetaceae bacterium]